MMNFELLEWGDGSIRLTHWDALHGGDITISLVSSGEAFLVTCDENDHERFERIDLVSFLRKKIMEK